MSNGTIHYAVLSLSKREAENLIPVLEEQGKGTVADWLKDNKESFYGDTPDHWKPFGGDPIETLVKDSSKSYVCETEAIWELLDSDPKTYGTFLLRSNIDVYFIDLFAMFLDQYATLATQNNSFLAGKHCCFIIYYRLPEEIQNQLEQLYLDKWPTVCTSYVDGGLHRIAVRVDDLKNFKNYLVTFSEKRGSHPANEPWLQANLGPTRDLPMNQ